MMQGKASESPSGQKPPSLQLSLALLGYVIGIIVVVTLLPFRFQYTLHMKILLYNGPFDLIANVCLFLPLGFLCGLARTHHIDRWGIQTALFGGLISLSLEIAQLFLRERYSSPFDLAANTLGAWIGVLLHHAMARRLNERLVGQLALELPLMTLFYLLVPLLWLDSLAAGHDGSRLWLALLLGLCGAIVLVAVWLYRLQPAGILSANALALIIALWFGIGTMPGVMQRPWLPIVGSLGLALGVRLMVRCPWLIVTNERRFERTTLRRLAPFYLTYVGLVGLWPWAWASAPWHAGVGFPDVPDSAPILTTLRVVEYIAAFTCMGYMVAEYRGRHHEPFWVVACWLLTSGVALGGLLELGRGFHPAYTASLAHLSIAMGVTLYGGMVYRLQLAGMQQWLARQPTSGVSGGTSAKGTHDPLQAIGPPAIRTDDR